VYAREGNGIGTVREERRRDVRRRRGKDRERWRRTGKDREG
jgi:hypothetical protein